MLSRDDDYRGLTARAVVAQEGVERRLGDVATELAQLRTKLDSIERTLSVVE